MEKSQEGIVVENNGMFAKITVRNHSSCGDCGACGSNGTSGADGPAITAYNPLHAKAGQKIRFVMAPGSMLKIAFLIFGMPLLAAFAAIGAGYLLSALTRFNRVALTALLVAVFEVLCVLAINLYDKKYGKKTKNFGRIIEILDKEA